MINSKKIAKVTSVTLAMAMAVSLMPEISLAGAKKPAFAKKSVSVAVGANTSVKFKNAKGVKKVSVKSANKKIATVKKMGKTGVTVTGKKEGKTKVSAVLSFKKAVAKKKKWTVKMTVNVTAKKDTNQDKPVVSAPAPSASAAVSAAPKASAAVSAAPSAAASKTDEPAKETEAAKTAEPAKATEDPKATEAPKDEPKEVDKSNTTPVDDPNEILVLNEGAAPNRIDNRLEQDMVTNPKIEKGKKLGNGELEKAPDYTGGIPKTIVGNPIVTNRFTADPWAMEYNGRVYVYGTNDSQASDKDPYNGNVYGNIKTLNCYSSADLINWTDHGEIPVAGNKGIAKWAGNSWAPCACHKKINGKEKFFLYFADNGGGIGVITADSPTGPWTDPTVSDKYKKGTQLVSRKTKTCSGAEVPWLFDPAVLVDDDGTGYLYFGGIGEHKDRETPNCMRVVKLNDDMVSLAEDPKIIPAPAPFEDSGIHKMNGKYYYSYCTNFSAPHKNPSKVSDEYKDVDFTKIGGGAIGVMVSDKPTEGFKFVGTVLDGPGAFFSGAGGNNHHCLMQFKGQFLAFYHTWRDSLAMGGKDYRTTYITPLNLGENGDFTNKDGSIAQTLMSRDGIYNSSGVINPYKIVEGETMAFAEKVNTVECDQPASFADWASVNRASKGVKAGGYLGLANVNFGIAGAKKIKATVNAPAGAAIKVYIDDFSAGKEVATINGAGSDAYTEVTADFKETVTGKHAVYFEFAAENVLFDKWVCE